MSVQPRWIRDLKRFLPLKSQFVLSGNVRDLQILSTESGVTPQQLLPYLSIELGDYGYPHVLTYDPVTGFRRFSRPGEPADAATALFARLGLTASDGVAPAGLDLFATTLERLVGDAVEPTALIADFASRFVSRTDALSPTEHQAFTRALVASHAARARPFGTPGRPYFNSVFWVVDKEGDLPDWLLVGNPRVRHIPIAKPDHVIRRPFAAALLRSLSGYEKADASAAETVLDDFVEGTEGLLLLDMQAIALLARTEGVEFSAISDAVRRYKVGVTEDPWLRIDREKIATSGTFIQRRVKGQDHAVTHILDIVKRAVVGVGGSKRGGRPRGVAFLAGPTGVGKTELAKTVTSLLFGDETAYIRFDMSEFSAEHSDQRLIGAPPGYVGYDVGGELTNAVRERPFSVVLFDEIEKAHPRILDKFLQILDDGVLTSGRGDRVYFSEAFIIFTSNLGIYRTGLDGTRVANVTPDQPFDQVRSKVRAEIESYFKMVLNRPEILNRIGENIIVFDFIREEIASQIFDAMVESLVGDLRQTQGIAIRFDQLALGKLHRACLADLSNGGRGIRNKIEAHLVNPLARALFDTSAKAGQTLNVVDVEVDEVTTLQLRTSDGSS